MQKNFLFSPLTSIHKSYLFRSWQSVRFSVIRNPRNLFSISRKKYNFRRFKVKIIIFSLGTPNRLFKQWEIRRNAAASPDQYHIFLVNKSVIWSGTSPTDLNSWKELLIPGFHFVQRDLLVYTLKLQYN